VILLIYTAASSLGACVCLEDVGFERIENFSTDPGWDARGNQRIAGSAKVLQDFGYSPTNNAGVSLGEIGGRISRSTTPAHYASPVDALGLDDFMSASGSIALLDDRDGGTFIGWFNASRQGWRPVNFLGFRLDGANLHVAYTTGTWRAMGMATGETLEIGTSYRWELLYDPLANGGKGTLSLAFGGEEYTLDLLPGHSEEGAMLDRFGIFNLQEPGGYQEVYLDDLDICGRHYDFDSDPGWDGKGNRASFTDRELRGTQRFGHVNSSHAGGGRGEIGGLIWRIESQAFYGDDVGSLTLDDQLSASGRLSVVQASSDSGFLFGWFNEGNRGWAPPNFLGFVVEGPSRVGHYFRLMYVGGDGSKGESEENPIIIPNGTEHLWRITYDPDDRIFSGVLDGEYVIETCLPGEVNATFNRFGILNLQEGGHEIEAYLDDLSYTSHELGDLPSILTLIAALLFLKQEWTYFI